MDYLLTTLASKKWLIARFDQDFMGKEIIYELRDFIEGPITRDAPHYARNLARSLEFAVRDRVTFCDSRAYLCVD